jgi:hypothetical protein
MKALVGVMTCGALMAVLAGCDNGWSAGSSADSYNSGPNGAVSFAGLYSPSAGNTYIVSAFSTTNATNSPGGTAVTELTFNVEQAGNTLRITDNNGSVYTGSIGADVFLGSPTPLAWTNNEQTAGGQTDQAQFQASGTSAAGKVVEMTGNFLAQSSESVSVVSDPNSTTNIVVIQTTWNRSIGGTWLEQAGTTGNINGEAAPIVTSGTSGGAGSAATTTTGG